MNLPGFAVVFTFALLYFFFVSRFVKNNKLKFMSLIFLFISPWFIQLLFSGIELWWIKKPVFGFSGFIDNLIMNFSVDYLFFKGDPRVLFGTQETGPFYIYQIPLILTGFYYLFGKFDKYASVLFGWLALGLVFASLFTTPDFSNCLFYFLPLQIVSFLGLVKLVALWQRKELSYRIFIAFFTLLATYEMSIYFHILLIHYPKRLLNI